ncbi:hypothetical protein GDO86_017462 [Hymenochirus boettgeri]|uniref:ERCC4 domain-containing protein n=1 Tax=Hymenochirus boettgeri TaxID=247094 RepID=A0A8T2IQ60_9PIPI|nr:hypothetical protein GDO86_017462 [Hymenochirus boettgeri]
MERTQENETERYSLVLSPRKLVQRAATWEISDSENEDESNYSQKNQKGPKLDKPAREITGSDQNVQSNSYIVSNFAFPVPTVISPSPNKKTRKKKSHEQVETEQSLATEIPVIVHKVQSETHFEEKCITLELPVPNAISPSPTRRSRKKKGTEQVETEQTKKTKMPASVDKVQVEPHVEEKVNNLKCPVSTVPSPSPTRRMKKKKSLEQMETEQLQATEIPVIAHKGQSKPHFEENSENEDESNNSQKVYQKGLKLDKPATEMTGSVQKVQSNSYIVNNLPFPVPTVISPSPNKKTRKKKSHKLVETEQSLAIEIPVIVNKVQSETHFEEKIMTFELPVPNAISPSPTRRSQKKKDTEQVETEQTKKTKMPVSAFYKEKMNITCPVSTVISPSPTRRTRKKKQVETEQTQATEMPVSVQEVQSAVCVEEKVNNLELPVPTVIIPSPAKRTKKKKSPEQLEAEQIQAEAKKRERELKRQEKSQQKELENMERQKRKEASLALKLLRPDQCVKYLIVQVDAGLLENAGSEDLFEALTSSGYNYSIEPHAVRQSFTWRREMPLDWTCIEGMDLKLGEQNDMLVLVKLKDFVSSVLAYVQAADYSRVEYELKEIPPGSVFSISAQHPDKKVTLVVMGLQEYQWCRSISRKLQRQTPGPKEQSHNQLGPFASWEQIQEALVFLQIHLNTEVLCLDTWKELGQHLCAVTKSVAQRPFRKHWEAESYSFCTSTGSWRGWGPKGALTGLPLTWKRQIQQLNRVSPAMAAAVTQAYPSPQLLMQAYASCGSDREKLSLLSDLRLSQERRSGFTRMAEDVTKDNIVPHDDDQASGKERRIGPDLSRRIWLLMTSTNPELVLDLNS